MPHSRQPALPSQGDALSDWTPPEPFLARMKRGFAVPIAAGAIVMVFAVVVSIVLVWASPTDSLGAQDLDAATAPEAAGEALEDGAVDSVTIHETLPAAEETPLTVHIVGEVKHPGVVTLPPGSRVEAALQAAGGATAEAVLEGVNLARVLGDGEQLVIPDEEGAAKKIQGSLQADAGGIGGADAGLPVQINLNTAQLADLESLPGIGPALAQRIIDYRTQIGAFTSVEQMLDVSGIGAKKFEELHSRVTL